MDNSLINDKIRGSLIGGAIGDALGYPVEFLPWSNIQNKYGAAGITRYDTADNGLAFVSDDTQMPLYTACGILNAKKDSSATMLAVCEAYIEWLLTQIKKDSTNAESVNFRK